MKHTLLILLIIAGTHLYAQNIFGDCTLRYIRQILDSANAIDEKRFSLSNSASCGSNVTNVLLDKNNNKTIIEFQDTVSTHIYICKKPHSITIEYMNCVFQGRIEQETMAIKSAQLKFFNSERITIHRKDGMWKHKSYKKMISGKMRRSESEFSQQELDGMLNNIRKWLFFF